MSEANRVSSLAWPPAPLRFGWLVTHDHLKVVGQYLPLPRWFLSSLIGGSTVSWVICPAQPAGRRETLRSQGR